MRKCFNDVTGSRVKISFVIVWRLIGDSLAVFVGAKAVNVDENRDDRLSLIARNQIVQENVGFVRALRLHLRVGEKVG